jgi:ABC-type cobalamin/Fe3+-siderophores transport system ATPase subunit
VSGLINTSGGFNEMEIDVTLKNYRCFSDEKPPTIRLRPGFTAFIGTNNAGKSSLLKSFFEFRNLFEAARENSGWLSLALIGRPQAFSHQPTTFDQTEIFNNSNDRDLVLEITLPESPSDAAAPIRRIRRLALRVPRNTNTWTATIDFDEYRLKEGQVAVNNNGIYEGQQKVADLLPMYAAIKDLTDTLFIGPFRNAVNIGSNDKYFDIETGQAFIGKWKFLKSGNFKDQNEASYRLTEEMREIFGFRSLEISPSADERTIQFLVDGRSFKLTEIGAGMAQFLMVLANAATRNPSYILIDEPELNLHPALQSKFLTTLGAYAKQGVLFATHSIGLARASADYIYSVRKPQNENSSVHDLEATPSFAEFLGELGFSGYKEIGYRKILFVEGRTDIKTFQEFLRKLDKDHEFVVLPLGGGDLINANVEHELCEVKRLCDSVFAIIDSERKAQGEELCASRKGFVESCRKVGITHKVMDRRATEHYLSESAIRKVKGNNYRALTEFEDRKAVSPMWSKTENWRIAREMTRSELEATDIGKFISSI